MKILRNGMSTRLSHCTAILLLALAATSAAAQTGPLQADLNAAAANAADWLHTNHDYGGQRFVDAKGIDRGNARLLRPVCRHDLVNLFPFHTNPVVHRGVMYLTTHRATIALDAASCQLRWRHDWTPKAREHFRQNRGVAVKTGRVVRGTLDGYLLALDADTGAVIWERVAADAAAGESFTMPPLIFEDLVIIGPAGSEMPIDGWIGAFRLATGEPVWRFNTKPRAGEPGAETWGATTAVTGGGAVWTPLSLDPVEGLVYVAVANPAPDFHGDVRAGDNLYTNALVVLDARTGRLVWHRQFVPHDTHDWDLTQVSPLFSARIDGELRRLVAVAGKDGLVRVLDRDRREQIFEVAVSRRENVDVPVTEKGVYACPGPLGGVQWNGPALNPNSATLFVASVDWCGTFRKARVPRLAAGELYMGGTFVRDPVEQARGWLTAIDAATGAIRWRYESRGPMLAAVTATSADLVFTGELTGDFLVLDARDGAVLYRHDTQGRMNGGVVTYQIGGRQYVAVTTGNASPMWRVPPASAAVIVFAVPSADP